MLTSLLNKCVLLERWYLIKKRFSNSSKNVLPQYGR